MDPKLVEELDKFSDEEGVDDKDLNSIFDAMESKTNLSAGQKTWARLWSVFGQIFSTHGMR